MATEPKKPITILGGKYELIGVERNSVLILKGKQVRWDYLTKEQASDLILEGNPHIKSIKPGKADESAKADEVPEETFPGASQQ